MLIKWLLHCVAVLRNASRDRYSRNGCEAHFNLRSLAPDKIVQGYAARVFAPAEVQKLARIRRQDKLERRTLEGRPEGHQRRGTHGRVEVDVEACARWVLDASGANRQILATNEGPENPELDECAVLGTRGWAND